MADSHLKPKSVVVGVFLTLAVYLSGLFVIITPLPLVYQALRFKSRGVLVVGGLSLAALVFLYLFALNPLHNFYQTHPEWEWLMPVPGLNLVDITSFSNVGVFGLLYFIFFVGVATYISQTLEDSQKLFSHISKAVMILFFACVAHYFIYAHLINSSALDFLTKYYQKVFLDFLVIQEKGGLTSSQLAYLREFLPQLVEYAVKLTPAFLLSSILLIVSLNLVISKKFLSPLISKLSEVRLNVWKLPFFLVWAFIFSTGLLLVNSYFLNNDYLFTLGANFCLVLIVVYYLQGLTVISHILEQRKVGALFRFLVWAFIILLFYSVGIFIAGLGLFDAWFDFRKLDKKQA